MSTTETPPGAPPPAAKGRGWLTKIVYGAIAVVFGLILVAKLMTWNDLPGCDSKRAKDTLSDIFKKNNVNATAYDEIKTLTSGNDEITCNATLSLQDKSKLTIDYKLFREGSDMRLLITKSNP